MLKFTKNNKEIRVVSTYDTTFVSVTNEIVADVAPIEAPTFDES